MTTSRRLALFVGLLGLTFAAMPANATPSESYLGPHFGADQMPAGCVADLNPANPDNHCYHMKVGLNALDSPQVDVRVLVPVSPTAERDLRMMKQSVQMWAGGIKYLSNQMDLAWLRDGVNFHITADAVPVDDLGNPTEALSLVDPEIVVIATNPAGGIGIGIDPSNFVSQLEITDGEGVPCTEIPNAFSMKAWQARPGFDDHHGDKGGVYVQDCGGVGGNVCFSVNGAVDPLPGASDFFPIYDLVSHETGHCLTLGHVGDGADGPWGPTPTNDIMAYSTDPPGVAKCVSTLDVEGFALRMSHYLDVNGDGAVSAADVVKPNDVEGDGLNSFQIQNPADHHYASATGDPADCPQPDYSPVPDALSGVATDWTPTPVATTRPRLQLGNLAAAGGRLSVSGTARRVPIVAPPTATSGSVTDPSGDSTTTVTDITGWQVKVSDKAVDAEMKVGQLWPGEIGSAATAYSILISGRRLDSFVPNGSTDGKPVVMDNGTGYYLPPGTATWDAATNTVKFHVSRQYLADNNITAPYSVTGVTGIHERNNDWVADDDHAPDKLGINLAGPPMAHVNLDKPLATSVTTTTVNVGSGSFTAAEQDLILTSNPAGGEQLLPLPIAKQSTVTATLTWDDPASSILLRLDNGSEAKVLKTTATSITIQVPWARRDLMVAVKPSMPFGIPEVNYTVKATITTLVNDTDHDRVPDVADACPKAAGPSAGAGCPDTDRDSVLDRFDSCRLAAGTGYNGCPEAKGEKVVVFVDGVRVAMQNVVTEHGPYGFALRAPIKPGKHAVRIVWYDGGKAIATTTRWLR